MDENKVAVLVLSTVLMSAGASSILYEVDVEESLNHSSFKLQYRENISDLQTYSAIIDNTGSVGCKFRLVNTLKSENYTRTDYSSAHELWPGESALIEVKSVPMNVTGRINSTLKIQYCGKEAVLNKTAFVDVENTTAGDRISSTTLKSKNGKLSFKTTLDEAYAVPISEPPYWKVESANISSGKASVEFEAPIYVKDESIVFALVNKTTGEVVGRTEVKTGSQVFGIDNIPGGLVGIVLVCSVIFNLVLGGRMLLRCIK
ncbi:MAG: hypothetical protein ABEK10_00555 [Candidatus Nanosalina sp.]